MGKEIEISEEIEQILTCIEIDYDEGAVRAIQDILKKISSKDNP